MLRIYQFFLISLTFCTGSLWGGGYQLSELGTPGMGLAGIGQAAIASDASTAYVNPAGMPWLCEDQVLIGIQAFRNDIRFKKEPDTTFSGGSGGQLGMTLGNNAFYLVRHFSDDVSFGFSVNSPLGAGLNYSRHWAGRYIVQSILVATIDFSPCVAIKVNRCLSIGGGFVVEYARLWDSIAINPAIFGLPPDTTPDGRLELDLDNWETAFFLGALWNICPTTRIGFVYRSVMRHRFEGRGKLTPKGTSFSVDTNFIIPQMATISLYHQLCPRFALVFDAGYTNYEEFKKQIIASDNGGQVTIPRNMRDIWHFGVGAQFRCTDRLLLQSGFSYDSSPERKEFRSPDLPLDTQYRYGFGILYDLNRCVTIGTAFEYADLGRNRMRNPLVQGDFKAMNGYWWNLTINRKF